MACNPTVEAPTWSLTRRFNPWRVFSWLATKAGRTRTADPTKVSIPGGFFRGLQQRDRRSRSTDRYARFQSLAGFFVACNLDPRSVLAVRSSGFNPWRVFSWLATGLRPSESRDARWFQSLAGFFVACNLPAIEASVTALLVSIPGGFFRGLQHIDLDPVLRAGSVSIPGGFFRGLQHIDPKKLCRSRIEVSIPGGFFRGLQLEDSDWNRLGLPSFNPWRVFSWLATCSGSNLPNGSSSSFNPWRVFSWLATPKTQARLTGTQAVSIPGGFFRGLQRRQDRRWNRLALCFNPWRVFSWLATECPAWEALK